MPGSAAGVTAPSPVLKGDEAYGPRLLLEPPSMVRFSSDAGTVLQCTADGRPTPTISWEMADGSPAHAVPGIREFRSDGSLVLRPFGSSQFLAEVHSATYRCLASNNQGRVKGRLVHVRGVAPENLVVSVPDVYAIRGNAAVLRCHLPTSVRDYVTVTSWIRSDGLAVANTAPIGQRSSESKYVMLPTGELIIREVSASEAFHSYRCQVHDALTGQSHLSSTAGKVIVTEPLGKLAPRMMESRRATQAQQGKQAVLPCVAQGHPSPRYSWFRLPSDYKGTVAQSHDSEIQMPVKPSEKVSLLSGGAVLMIYAAVPEDEGRYLCFANNSAGQDKAYTDLFVTAPLSATIDPPVQLVDAGRSANLSCRVAGRPVEEVLWMHNGVPLFASSSPSGSTGTGSGKITSVSGSANVALLSRDVLRVAPVERRDSGMYQCLVYNRQDSAQGTAQILVTEDAPVLEHAFPEIQVAPGSSASLKCSASGNPLPQVTWTLDGEVVPEHYHVRIGDYVSSERLVHSYVNLTSVRVEDGGLYSCVARNSAGQASHSARLVVPGKPVARRPTANVTALAGRTVRLYCPVAGYPIHSIAWQKDGRWLPQNHRQRSFPNGTLVVTQVQRSQDTGWYECTARDAQGNTARGQLAVRVMTPPVVSPFNFPDDLTEGKRAGAACIVSDGDPPISIGWLKDGRPLDEKALGATASRTNDYTSFLSIIAVRQELHRGLYTCVASNPAASANYTAPMLVRVGPRWQHEPEDKAAILGQPLMFHCQAHGFPIPVIRWKKERFCVCVFLAPVSDDGSRQFATITSSSRSRVLENGSLVINEVERSDAGRYLCQIQNGVGSGISTVVKLDVHEAAHFERRFRAVTARRGDPVSLACKAQGESPIKLTWTRDGHHFNPTQESRYLVQENSGDGWSESVLRLTNSDRRDSAALTCHAENAYGGDDTVFQLIVQEPPGKPQGLETIQTTSRTVTLAWLAPFSGNSPVVKYLLEHKSSTGSWEYDTQLSPEDTSKLSYLVTGLRPATKYEFRIRAGNALGLSDHSDPLVVTTDQEAPSGTPQEIQVTPTGSRSLHVTWKEPPEEETNGPVQGYYVGYRVRGSGLPYSYKTLQSAAPSSPAQPQHQECHLRELRPRTRYGIVVQAFNAKGAGPASEEVAAQTLDFDRPASPRLKLVSSTSSSINLSWDVTDDQPVDGYLLFNKAEPGPERRSPATETAPSSDWSSVQTDAERSTHAFRGLGCGRSYAFYVVAFNGAGRGARSNVVLAKTDGSVPVAPDMREFVAANVTWATLRLGTWRSGGCPISSFTVLYKRQSSSDWTPAATRHVSELGLPHHPHVTIDDLAPATWYQLLVTAHSEAGSTEAEYVFATLTLAGGTVPPPHWIQVIESQRRRIHVIVPVVCFLVVTLLVAVVVGCTVSRRRLAALHRRRLLWRPEEADGAPRTTTKCIDTVPMTVWKKAGLEQPKSGPRTEKLYWPSPLRSRAMSRDVEADGDGARCKAWARSLATIHEDYKVEAEASGGKKAEHTYAVPFAPSNTVQKLEERDDLLASAERLASCMSPRQDLSHATASLEARRETAETDSR
ncbi:Down syndrome cell adhesion molecule-like protein Dscam2 [Dermacentor silvarum]|uniref:Down syndrome cell adhesion molecule-like protein Dscam2 n=1 Tax=Dermacentor silvarum TaxID=543639 RepID=UPI002101202C|nr:Down syndrome cell adhesion molecule-like protein Dscam2 [Dermacentor silvarum]